MVPTIEAGQIRVFGNMPRSNLVKNSNLVYSNFSMLPHASIFDNSSPFTFMLPLLTLQLALASTAILLTFSLLKRLGLPLMFSQILGGILVGPSTWIPWFLNTIFPIRSFLIMNVVSIMGFMFYFFLVGVQTDVLMLNKITKKTFAIGFFAVSLPMILTLSTTLVWMQFNDPNEKTIDRLPAIAEAVSMVSYSMVTYYLAGLRVINSEIDRVAVCSSMIAVMAHALAVHEGFSKRDSRSGIRNSIYEPATATNPVSAWITVLPSIDWMCPSNSCATPHAPM